MDTMEAIYRCVSGLDVHKKTVVACRRRLLESGKVDKRDYQDLNAYNLLIYKIIL